MKKMIKKAYAKINYSLKVLGKRPDGYHELDMLMVNINLFDILTFKKIKNGIIVECSNNVCKMEDSIVYKVFKLIINTSQLEQRCDSCGISLK